MQRLRLKGSRYVFEVATVSARVDGRDALDVREVLERDEEPGAAAWRFEMRGAQADLDLASVGTLVSELDPPRAAAAQPAVQGIDQVRGQLQHIGDLASDDGLE